MMELHLLRRLARWYGVQTEYRDISRQVCQASPETLLRTLQAMGAPLGGMGDVPQALRQRRQELWQRATPPVVVAWDGDGDVRLRLPNSQGNGPARIDCCLTCEDGEITQWHAFVQHVPAVGRRTVEGVDYVQRRLSLPPGLPLGYHRLELSWPGHTAETLVISAPSRAYSLRQDQRAAAWGVFLPLYALHRESSWGGGDLSDLREMAHWAAGRGGRLVATLPMLGWLYELKEDPSPYAPTSRLFWNDFYIDVTAIPELAHCEAAKSLASSSAFQQELAELRRQPTVDYHRQMRLKRQVLELLAQNFFSRDSSRRAKFAAFCQQQPEVEEYARFRAVGEQQGKHWIFWPQPLYAAQTCASDYDERVARLHAYVQWQVEEQLEAVAAETRAGNLLWYLDFPLGVSRAGYDVWRQREVFALGANGGAPPDTFFTKGQNWGFPPLHPQRLREQRYEYFIAALRRHLQFARVLRIDHVMGLYRLFWVPEGMDAKEGAYVRYPAEELFAIITLESHRHKAQIVGENLGTVPPAVDAALHRHGIQGMYVGQFEIDAGRWPPIRTPSANAVASMNTHDLPTFSAFWNALDVDDHVALGLMTEGEANAERGRRGAMRHQLTVYLREIGLLAADAHEPHAVLEALLRWLGASPAPTVLASLEDLWGETQPQNTPGTFEERCNWRRKARLRFEEFRELPSVLQALAKLDEGRRQSPARTAGPPPMHALKRPAAVTHQRSDEQ
jgi:4-alpha-glucanotransferase